MSLPEATFNIFNHRPGDSIAIKACEDAGQWALALGLFNSLQSINDVCLSEERRSELSWG